MGDEARGASRGRRLGGDSRGADVRLCVTGVALREAIGWLVAGRWLEELMIRLQCREAKWNRRPF